MNEKAGRTANVKRNILYGFLQFIVSHILPFIVRTLLIYRFGVEYLGLNSLFASVLSVLSLMDLGFGTAVVYSMYKPVAEDNKDQICAFLTYYRKIYHWVGTAIFVAGLFLMPVLKYFIKDPALPGNLNLYVCYIMFLCNAVISYLLFGYLTAIPMAYQRRDILSRVDMAVSLLSCVIKAFILLFSSNFYLYLLAMPILTVVHNLLNAYIIKKKYPGLQCRGDLGREQKRDLRTKVYGILINKLTNVSRNSIDSLCISAFIGLTMTGLYNNYYFIMSSVLSCGIMICHSMLASIGNSIAVESRKKNYSDMRMFDFIFMALIGWACTCMLCLYQPFISIWVGNKMMFDIPIVIGFCGYFYIMESGAIQWLYQQGAGLWYECRYIMVGEAATNVVLNIVLCRLFGVLGIVVATVISVFITNFILCPRVVFRHYFKNGKLKEYWLDHACYTFTMILTAMVSGLVCNALFPLNMAQTRSISGFTCLGGRLAICSFLSVVVFWIFWHRSARYNIAIGWLIKMMKA